MANIQERRDKSGKLISYSTRVHRGRGQDGKQLKPWTATFDVVPTWTEKSAKKKAEAFAATFEKECRERKIKIYLSKDTSGRALEGLYVKMQEALEEFGN